jgi:hypothetical protein
MATITLIVLALLAALTIYAMRRSALIIGAERQQRLLSDGSIGCHTPLGDIGCSLICRRVESMAQVENLLSVTYERYEAIVMIDATLQPELFAALVARYRMVRVNSPDTTQNSTNGRNDSPKIRSLYRSAERRYRRLVVAEISADTNPYAALNEVLSIASHNFVICIGSGVYIRPQAIHSIAITLSDSAALCPEALISLSDEPYHALRREAVILRGGFSPALLSKIPRSKRLYTHQSFTLTSTTDHPPRRPMAGLAVGLTIGFVVVLTTLFTPLLGIAALTTLLAILSIARHQSEVCNAGKCSARTMLCYFRRLKMIFSRQKFIIT